MGNLQGQGRRDWTTVRRAQHNDYCCDREIVRGIQKVYEIAHLIMGGVCSNPSRVVVAYLA